MLSDTAVSRDRFMRSWPSGRALDLQPKTPGSNPGERFAFFYEDCDLEGIFMCSRVRTHASRARAKFGSVASKWRGVWKGASSAVSVRGDRIARGGTDHGVALYY